MAGKIRQHRLSQYIPLITLPVILAVCLALWSLTANTQHIDMDSDTGVWDLRDFDFSSGAARILGAVEYIPDALLTPKEFAARSGEIQFGRPQDNDVLYCTSRLRILVPEGAVYAIACRSIDYSERIYINGQHMADIGLPGDSRETSIPDTASLSFMAEPVNGVIEIVRQTSNFVHRESGWHDGVRIGLPRIVQASYQHYAEAIIMGCFLALFLVHLALYFILRTYPANLYFSLFCLTWFLRTGVTESKIFAALLPELPWIVKFRIEYLSLPVAAILLMLMLRELFPDVVPKWLCRSVCILSGSFLVIFLLTDSLFMSWAIFGCFACFAAAILAIGVCFFLRLRSPGLVQILSLAGVAALFYSSLRDMFYYNNILLPPFLHADLSKISMLIFVFFQMTAMFMGTVHTAEEAHAAEQRLAAENAVLERISRMRSELTTTVSHEMRTPLAVMSAYAQLSVEAIQEGRSDAQTAANLEMISTEALRLADMATDLLQLSIAQEDDKARTRFDLGGVLRQTAHLCESMLNKGGNTLILEIADDLPAVYCNAGELTQVLWNLLSNAAAHTRDGEVAVVAKLAGNNIAVTVRDIGEGIAPKLLPYVFQRYRHGNPEGTGVGLAVCREIIEAHGGSIAVESEIGRGTAVTFTVPIGEEESI